jgi:phospholipid-binding lipoprotein MlaA
MSHSLPGTFIQKFMMIGLCSFLVLGMTGCASAKHDFQTNAQISDPLEPLNRGVFAFNNTLDRFLVEPVAKIYNAIFPDFFRDGVQNFMRNLRAPLIVGNNVLQGDFKGAGVATARFAINTTAGIAGLIDVAAAQGLEYEQEDFGQTLAVWGLGDGFYLVLPVLGPTTLRDGTGALVDAFADPVRLYAFNRDEEWIYYTRGLVEAVDNRARIVRAVEDLRRNSLDYYAAVRSAYTQNRRALIRDQKPNKPPMATEQYSEFDYYEAGWE